MYILYTHCILVQSNLKADHVNNPKKYVYFYICMCLMWFFFFMYYVNIYINRGCLANCTLFPFFFYIDKVSSLYDIPVVYIMYL